MKRVGVQGEVDISSFVTFDGVFDLAPEFLYEKVSSRALPI